MLTGQIQNQNNCFGQLVNSTSSNRIKSEMGQDELCNNSLCRFYSAFDSAVEGGTPILQPLPDVRITNSYFAIPSSPGKVPPYGEQEDKPRGLQAILSNVGEVGHTALDIAGLVPMFGEVADLANAGLYCLEGDFANATLSAAAAIPFYGNAIATMKLGRIHGQAQEMADDMRDLTDSVTNRRGVGSGVDSKSLTIALPAFAFGVVVGAVGARHYWPIGLRVMARARKWRKESLRSKAAAGK